MNWKHFHFSCLLLLFSCCIRLKEEEEVGKREKELRAREREKKLSCWKQMAKGSELARSVYLQWAATLAAVLVSVRVHANAIQSARASEREQNRKESVWERKTHSCSLSLKHTQVERSRAKGSGWPPDWASRSEQERTPHLAGHLQAQKAERARERARYILTYSFSEKKCTSERWIRDERRMITKSQPARVVSRRLLCWVRVRADH